MNKVHSPIFSPATYLRYTVASYSVMDTLQGCGHTCMANFKPSFKLATVMDYMVRYFSETLVNNFPTGTSQKSFGHKPQSTQSHSTINSTMQSEHLNSLVTFIFPIRKLWILLNILHRSKLIFLYLKTRHCKCYALNIMYTKLHKLSWIRTQQNT